MLEHKKAIPAFVWQILLMGLLGLSGVIFMPILLRQVEAQIMATVLVAQVYIYYLLLLVQFGFNWSSPAAFARAESQFDAASIWRTSIRLKLAMLIGPTAILVAVGYWWLGFGAIYLSGFGLLLAATAVNSNWLLQARLDFFSGVVLAFIGVLTSALGLYLLAYGGLSLDTATSGVCTVFILICPASFLGLGSWWLSKRLCIDGKPRAVKAWRRSDVLLLWENMPLVVTQLLQLVSATLGTVIVSSLADVITTNAYAAMERFFNLSASVIVALYMAAYPRLAALYYEKRSAYWAQIGKLLRIGGALGLGLSVLFMIFGQRLLVIYVSAPLAAKVASVMLPFVVWIGLYLSQHVLTGYFVFAQRNGMVLLVNALILLVTVGVGYPMARHDPVLWVYGMLAGQAIAVMWLIRLYHQDKYKSVDR